MKKLFIGLLAAALAFRIIAVSLSAQAGAALTYIPYSDAKPIVEALRDDLLPPDLRDKTPAEREAVWSEWSARRDAAIRARVASGDEDSVLNLLLYGTTFTEKARPTASDLAVFVNHPTEAPMWLRARIDDFVAGLASPGSNEHMRFARDVIRAHGMDTGTAAGQIDARRYLQERAIAENAAAMQRTRTSLGKAGTEPSDRLSVFRERGLSSDTSIFVDFGIDETLAAIKSKKLVSAGNVHRVAVIGPGLDFTDKLEGYDFYPPQTIQPFAIIDSLMRLGLAARDLQIAALDLSPRILQHIDVARARARAGQWYPLVVPRNLDQSWSPRLVKYWEGFGDEVGRKTTAPALPPNAGPADARGILVRPSSVLATIPHNVNIVLQRLEPLAPGERFDLVIATNILVYYDVFEQALASVNIAKMLRPGGLLLTNNPIFDLPGISLRPVGFSDIYYIGFPAVGETGDRIMWYERS